MYRLPLAIVIVVFASALSGWSPQAAAQATTYEVSGKVVSDEGKPLEGALVYGETYSEAGSSADKAQTDASGAFTLRLAAGKGWVNVRYEPWGAGDSREILVEGKVGDLAFTLKTPPPKTSIVQGRVLDEAGNPVEGALVRIDQGCCYAYDYAYSSGSGGAPPPEATPTPATAPAEGNSSSGSAGSGAAKASPAIAVMPSPCCCCYSPGEEMKTGADGAFRFKTYAGTYQVMASKDGFAYTTVNVEVKDNATATKDVVLYKVPAADAVVTGRVVDAETGAPIANAQVSLANQAWSRYEYATTGADGSYRIKSLPGWSQLTVHAYSYGIAEPVPMAEGDAVSSSPGLTRPHVMPGSGKGYYQHVQALDVPSGETKVDVRLEPRPEATVVLQGYVVDPAKKAGIPGANVQVWNQDTGDWGSAVTDETGSYKILVRPGHYTASTWADGYLPGAGAFVIAEGETLKRVDLQSPAGQVRHAPCSECDARVMYAEKGGYAMATGAPADVDMDEGGAGVSSSSSPAPAPASTRAAGSTTGASESASLAGGDGAQRGSSYVGSGGGLPPYDPGSAPAQGGVAGADNLGGENPVPGLGLLGALAAVGLALAVLARRRRG